MSERDSAERPAGARVRRSPSAPFSTAPDLQPTGSPAIALVRGSDVQHVLALQRSSGNRSVAQLLGAQSLPDLVALQTDRSREDESRRQRGTGRTYLSPDVGRRRYSRARDWLWERGTPAAPVDEATTETRLQGQVALLRPRIPEWWDTTGMATFDSDFYGDPGRYTFRGREMDGWEVNYYFVSMALAHQGWDWNEAQTMIWAWNASQDVGVNPFGGGGDMTGEMWFASWEGFSDEQARMARDALTPPAPPPAAP